MLEIRLLGGFTLLLDGHPVDLPSRPAQSLLAYLALNAGAAQRREKLAGLLWPETDEASARRNLRHTLWRLRQAVGEAPLPADKLSIKFETNQDTWLDVGVFTSGEDRNVEDLVEAVSAYGGELLPGFYDDWVAIEREQLAAVFERKMQKLHSLLTEERRWDDVLEWAERWVALGGSPEPAFRALMVAHGELGDLSGVAAAYQRCVAALQELDLEPSPETTTLFERLRVADPSDLPAPSRVIRGYELRERIGAGGFGVVHRAYQAAVRRDVAIKVIHPQFADHPDFIRRFEAEAQLVARIEHPHIVPLYDYWREPGGAYLVMRWLRGGSLKDSFDRGPWPVDKVAQIFQQIAAALDTAHQQGVVHSDIKPANILLDEAGNAYLSDFGIAKDVGGVPGDTQPGSVTGSPAYISPEQVQSQPVSPQSDIYSLGVMLYELLTGQHPFQGETSAVLLIKHISDPLPLLRETRPELAHGLDEVIQRATAKDPAERHPDALALAAHLKETLGAAAEPLIKSLPEVVVKADIQNPYKGLRAFQEMDAGDFYGREALVERLVDRLGESRFLAVVGPSGSGKSSVTRAGLVPALRRGAIQGSESWFIIQMLPGAHPFEELESALLRIAVNPPPSMLEQLIKDEYGLQRAVKRSLPDDDSELLLLIDQFEELFTLLENEATRARFIGSLLAAVTDPHSQLRVTITLRADFYDRPLMVPEFAELIEDATIVVPPLKLEELERAIARPAEGVGVGLEQGLVTAIAGDVQEQPGALPLLQYALTELFERRQNGVMTLDAYHQTGGVTGAVARRAEELYQGLDVDGREAARQLFLRLVTLGEGVGEGEGSPDTRRRVLQSEVETLHGTSQQMPGVIDAFGSARLLTFDRDRATRGPTVEVAHEALLVEWRHLRDWLDESRADVRLQRILGSAAAEWRGADRDPGFLLRGSRLDQFEAWAAETQIALTADERAFLDASLAEKKEREAARQAREARERQLEQRSLRRLRIIVAVLVLAAIVGLTLTIAVINQSRVAQRNEALADANSATATVAQGLALFEAATAEAETAARATIQADAEERARLATSRELAASAINNLEVDAERSILLALQALSAAHTRQAEEALHRAIQASRTMLVFSGHTDRVLQVDINPDGTRLATGSEDGTAKVWDTTTGQELLTLTGHTDRVLDVDFSPDGARLATSSEDGTTIIWDTSSGQEMLTLDRTTGEPWPRNPSDFSPDGTILATGEPGGVVKLWDAKTGQELLTLTGHTDWLSDLKFSPDGRRLATASRDNTAKVWDVSALGPEPVEEPGEGADTSRELFTLSGHSDVVMGVAFSPDGERLATASFDATVIIWDAATGRERFTLTVGEANAVAFSPDGTRLAAGLDEATAVWNISSTGGQEWLRLTGHRGRINHVAFNPDGSRLATAGWDGIARLWDVTAMNGREWFAGVDMRHGDFFKGAAFSPDGKRVASASFDGTARVWDAATGEVLLTLREHDGPVHDVDFSPDGTRLATAGADGTARVWDGATGQELLTITGHPEGVFATSRNWPGIIEVSFSPDGKRLATAGADGTARVWDTATGEELVILSGHTGGLFNVRFSPDGMRLATSGLDGAAKVWDATTGQELLTLENRDFGGWALAFSPDGSRVARSDRANLKVWDVVSGELLLELAGHLVAVLGVDFSPDGARIATGSGDGTVKIWDATTGDLLLTLYATPDGLNKVAFSPDGKRLVTTGRDGVLRMFVLDLEDLVALAHSRLTRWFTPDECEQFLNTETCPPAPEGLEQRS